MDLQEMLGEELFKQVIEKMGDKKLIINDGSFIPKAKFDDVNTIKNELKAQVEGYTKQLADLQTKAVGNEELGRKLAELQVQNEKASTDFESKLKQKTLDNAVDIAIMSAKGKNSKALKALLNYEQIKMDGDNVVGVEEQIKNLKVSESYLFDNGQTSSGANPPPAYVPELVQLKTQHGELMKQGKLAEAISVKNRIFSLEHK